MTREEIVIHLRKGTYIGDGVYAYHDGYQFWLRCERDGLEQLIALEPEVFRDLLAYKDRTEKEISAWITEQNTAKTD